MFEAVFSTNYSKKSVFRSGPQGRINSSPNPKWRKAGLKISTTTTTTDTRS